MRKNVEIIGVVKTLIITAETLIFNRITLERDTVNDERVKFSYMMVEAAVAQFDTCTKAIMRFIVFF